MFLAIAAKSSAHRAAGLDGAGRRHGQKAADKGRASRFGAQDESSEPANQELLYAARVSLDRSQMLIDDRLVNLSPGVAVTVARPAHGGLSANCFLRW